MIASVRGTLLEKQPTRLVVEVGGVGLEVLVPVPTAQAAGKPGDAVFLHTALVVREDALTLYGFTTREERELFGRLTSVSGIGPKIAISALSGASLDDLVVAIRSGDILFLTRIPGVGKKTAERMALELKDALAVFGAEASAPGPQREEADAVGALVSLGYSRSLAEKAARKAAADLGDGDGVESIIRRALAALASGKG